MSNIQSLNIKKDISLIKGHLLSLDKESLHQRFNYSASIEHLEKYCNNITENDICVGVIVKVNNNDFLAGFLHVAIFDNNAEIGISVHKDYRGNQFATAMMVMAIFELQQKIIQDKIIIKDVLMYCDSSNKASIALGKKFGLHVIIESSSNTLDIKQTKKFKEFA